MTTPLVQVGATILCPHGGQVTVVPGNLRVQLSGQPLATLADQYLIAGCPFTLPSGTPSPCVRVQWISPAVRVMAGAPAITLQSQGLCLAATMAPQGPPIIASTQPRAGGV